MLKADVVLTGGRIWRGLAEGDCEALALWGGRVLACGRTDEIASLIGPETTVVHLAGRLATPALNDAHLHLLPLGLTMAEIDVRTSVAPTRAAMLDRIRDAAASRPAGEWILARGYDQGRWQDGAHPTVDDLDAAAPDHPVYLVRACGHVSVVNSAAMRLAGLTAETPTPPGGMIERRDGRLTGLLAENGRDAVKALLPAPTDEALVAAIERAGRAALSYGIASVMDAAVGMRAGRRELAAYRTAQRTRRLPVRTHQCLLGGANGVAADAVAEGMITGAGDGMLSVGPVKIFTDGSAGGRTAAMSQPYLGEPETYGMMCLSDEECHAEIMRYHKSGCQMAIHAIGDAAIEQVLTGYERALDAAPAPDRRHRIEHCGFLTGGQLARMAARGVLPAPQPAFLYDFGDLYLEVVGPERTEPSYPMRSWNDAGLNPSASTDAPVTDITPFPNLYTMVTRKTRTGRTLGADQALTMAQALHAYTLASAYACHQETWKGVLSPGFAADVAVFSDDLFAMEPEALLSDVRCDLTILGGAVVHGEA